MHKLQNGSQVDVMPDLKNPIGTAGFFTESGENGEPSYPGADWFNTNIMEFQTILTSGGISFDRNRFDHIQRAIAAQCELVVDTIRNNLFPIGGAIPWPTDIAPTGFAIMKGQGFDVSVFTETAKAYPNGILDDMRGLAVVGKKDGELILAYEADGVKSHAHNASASSPDLGTKWTSVGGGHTHGVRSRIAYGSGTHRALDSESGGIEGQGTDYAGDHSHPIYIGPHSHAIYVAAYGHAENTIKNRKFNWIVRLA